MDYELTSKKVDTLINHIVEFCEREGATVLEVKMAVNRLHRILSDLIDEIESEQPFTACAVNKNALPDVTSIR